MGKTVSGSNAVPLVVTTATDLRAAVGRARAAGKTIGLVPTMGALHEGHLSLVDASRGECGLTVVSVFVNPTQFGPGEDFGHYPRQLSTDVELLGGRGAELVFAPATELMYAPGHATYVDMSGPAESLEGRFRPGHFRGVATIVLKLFNLARPDRAYFGRKDYQQSLVVRRMVADLDLPIEIRVCPTVREPDGLALSSRNAYLSPDERRRALAVSAGLRLAREMAQQGTVDARAIQARVEATLTAAKLQIDYVALVDPETLSPVLHVDRSTVVAVAVRVGATRLIDNDTIG
jgi:pantoate--beta-alanine ligase